MFEKSLYDLIRGMRQHKGSERDFIEHSLKECRREIRGSDMDLKATALLKLTYLEMFGYDMSWAAFNILEVMSAAKQHQKRIGYLGAVQTFGPNTDVLMLATNLLKKDVTSSVASVISLPLVTMPHLVSPGLANAVVPDLLARMGHSSPNIRKKSIVTLYRLALVWPEALRPAWPRMKEMLENDDEDPSVTATVVNVVCELVWRRPEDFLPLAPRFFDLLVNGGNNWMAIKLIKLFATLTPLEPRLIRKLAPALTNLIKTTPAMSVLYECINGIVQGGILDGTQGIREGDEIAELCVDKLRGMIAVDGDPNLKFVSLLAFNKIVVSHPHLVSTQQDVIVSCLDDGDVSIRAQAMALVSRTVGPDNIVYIVEKLLQQLRSDRQDRTDPAGGAAREAARPPGEFDGAFRSNDTRQYEFNVIQQILGMCTKGMYENITDFDWYIDIIVQLVHVSIGLTTIDPVPFHGSTAVFEAVGAELRNVTVRVKSARAHATEAASELLSSLGRPQANDNPTFGAGSVLRYVTYIVGEYPGLLPDSHATLNVLLTNLDVTLPSVLLVSFLQAISKLTSYIFSTELNPWHFRKRDTPALILARLAQAIEAFTTNEDIEVQESAIVLLELARISEGALAKHPDDELVAPVLVHKIVPSLFAGQELNPVAVTAQSKVPQPTGFDFDALINPSLPAVLRNSEYWQEDGTPPTSNAFYREREEETTDPRMPLEAGHQAAAALLEDREGSGPLRRENRADAGTALQPERDANDPFYISTMPGSGAARISQMHDIIQDSNGQSLDIDSIPILELKLDSETRRPPNSGKSPPKRTVSGRVGGQSRAHITSDETLESPDGRDPVPDNRSARSKTGRFKAARALLQVDSSTLEHLSPGPQTEQSVQEPGPGGAAGPSRQFNHEEEMKRALAEVERLRLEMQRARDRVVVAKDIPEEGTLVAKRKKRAKGDRTDERSRQDGRQARRGGKKEKEKEKAAAAA